MSSKFKISVEIINDGGTKTIKPIIIEKDIPSIDDFMDGNNFRTNFDNYERSVLQARKEVIEIATEGYLEEASKKNYEQREESQKKDEIEIVKNGYSVESEIGRIFINTYRKKMGSRIIYDTRKDIFPKKASLESYRTICFDELLFLLPSKDSYRFSEKIINRVCWQQGKNEIKYRTIANIIEKESCKIISQIENKSLDILKKNGFDKDGIIKDKEYIQNNDNEKTNLLPEDQVINAIESYNEGKTKEMQIEITELHESYENKEFATNISADDVFAKKQKESGRSKYSEHKRKGTRQFVKNTVVHIQSNKDRYIINGSSISQVFKWLIAFLFNNNLVRKGILVFFVDGADDLKYGIKKFFGWINYKIILDWYHLKKKCELRLSMDIKGTINRNMVLDEVLTYLWVGKVDAAVSYLYEMVKDFSQIKKLIVYFDRNWSYMSCYALRKSLGLRNSSNIGEKANHLIISDRQKKNGMSWSKDGSISLGTVAAVNFNKENNNWIKNREFEFKFSKLEKCA